MKNENQGNPEERQLLGSNWDRPTEITDNAKWNEMDGNAIANIHLALADEVLLSVAEKKTAKDI